MKLNEFLWMVGILAAAFLLLGVISWTSGFSVEGGTASLVFNGLSPFLFGVLIAGVLAVLVVILIRAENL